MPPSTAPLPNCFRQIAPTNF
uniref:Uncharacterized protein n=1 Tax=Anguilla anguilla TaxID=7936 RepID=A0A0E9SI82_ANGAN